MEYGRDAAKCGGLPIYTVGPLVIDTLFRRLSINDSPFLARSIREPETLSPKRTLFVRALINANGRVVANKELAQAVWGETLPRSPRGALRTLATHVRKNIKDAEIKPWRDVGYQIVPRARDQSPLSVELSPSEACFAGILAAAADTIVMQRYIKWRMLRIREENLTDAEFARTERYVFLVAHRFRDKLALLGCAEHLSSARYGGYKLRSEIPE